MEWLNDFAYFWGGAFLSNAVPHLVSGVMGHPFQSPFAKPHGQGLSSSSGCDKSSNYFWSRPGGENRCGYFAR